MNKPMVEPPAISVALLTVGGIEIAVCVLLFLCGLAKYGQGFSSEAAALMKISVPGAVGGLLWLAAGETIFWLARIERALRGPVLAPAIVPAAENRMI